MKDDLQYQYRARDEGCTWINCTDLEAIQAITEGFEVRTLVEGGIYGDLHFAAKRLVRMLPQPGGPAFRVFFAREPLAQLIDQLKRFDPVNLPVLEPRQKEGGDV